MSKAKKNAVINLMQVYKGGMPPLSSILISASMTSITTMLAAI